MSTSSGVYWFKNADNEILYIGKAKNLKQRIGSYKLPRILDPKTAKLVSLAVSLHCQVTDTEIDALILEANLINQYQPPYNRLLKDDKTPCYLYFTKPPASTLKIVRFTDLPARLPKKDYFGPFQSAFELKKLVLHIRHLFPFCSATPKQYTDKKACFYYHIHLCPGLCVGQFSLDEYRIRMKQIRQFLRGQKKGIIRSLRTDIKKAITSENFEEAQVKKEQIALLQFKSKPGFDYEVPFIKSGRNNESLHQLLQVLKKGLSLPATYPLHRIEGYDISNIQGKWATGSMVVCENGSMNSALYRHFKIKTKNTPDDPAMMTEMLQRRVKHREWGIPNAICIDGGKTQLNAALKCVPWNIPIFSLVKKPERLLMKKAGRFYATPRGDTAFSKLLRVIRDESHRFARRYHRRLTLNIR